jgi:SAM-dependent methyltransferase
MSSEWFETFFTPLALDFWRSAVPSTATDEEVEFLVRNLAVAPPSRLLDLPCGLGRHAIALASRGYRVTGIDIAPSAVLAARQEAEALGLRTVRFLVGDMRQACLDGPFDGAYCFGNSFTYLSHEDTIGFARNVFDAVRPGARWIIDTGMAAELLLPQLTDERQLEVGGITYAVQNSYDAVAGRLIQACTFSRGAERELAQTNQGVYTVAELHRLLQSQGWMTLGAFGSLDGKPFTLRDRRLLLIAQRP